MEEIFDCSKLRNRSKFRSHRYTLLYIILCYISLAILYILPIILMILNFPLYGNISTIFIISTLIVCIIYGRYMISLIIFILYHIFQCYYKLI